MTKTAADVKGITTEDERPAVIPMKTDMENKHLSKAQYIEKYKNKAEEEKAAEEARQKFRASKKGAKPVEVGVEDNAENESKISALREQLAEVEAKLKKDPESKKLLKEKNKIAAELDTLEDGQE